MIPEEMNAVDQALHGQNVTEKATDGADDCKDAWKPDKTKFNADDFQKYYKGPRYKAKGNEDKILERAKASAEYILKEKGIISYEKLISTHDLIGRIFESEIDYLNGVKLGARANYDVYNLLLDYYEYIKTLNGDPKISANAEEFKANHNNDYETLIALNGNNTDFVFNLTPTQLEKFKGLQPLTEDVKKSLDVLSLYLLRNKAHEYIKAVGEGTEGEKTTNEEIDAVCEISRYWLEKLNYFSEAEKNEITKACRELLDEHAAKNKGNKPSLWPSVKNTFNPDKKAAQQQQPNKSNISKSKIEKTIKLLRNILSITWVLDTSLSIDKIKEPFKWIHQFADTKVPTCIENIREHNKNLSRGDNIEEPSNENKFYGLKGNGKPSAALTEAIQNYNDREKFYVENKSFIALFCECFKISSGKPEDIDFHSNSHVHNHDLKAWVEIFQEFQKDKEDKAIYRNLAEITLEKSLSDYNKTCSELYKRNKIKSDYAEVYQNRITSNNDNKIKYECSNADSDKFAKNLIVFGAPGTGKSYKLNQKKDGTHTETSSQKSEGLHPASTERVTFHADYSYFDFVGSYKPVMVEMMDADTAEPMYEIGVNAEGKEKKTNVRKKLIHYTFVPGPFTRVLTRALIDIAKNENEAKPHLLIIEEINRARTAAVFGDTFQLLDRSKDSLYASTFPIALSEEMKSYIRAAFAEAGIASRFTWNTIRDYKIPSNMYIWATMNSADQGVYPLDTAFKRRWQFEYMGIDEGSDTVNKIKCDDDDTSVFYGRLWNVWRKAINKTLKVAGINEDKLLGPFFLGMDALKGKEEFIQAFSAKVLMYLREDVLRTKRGVLFKEKDAHFSDISAKFMKEMGKEDGNILEILDIDLPKDEKSKDTPAVEYKCINAYEKYVKRSNDNTLANGTPE